MPRTTTLFCQCLVTFVLAASNARGDLVSHWRLDGDLTDSGPSGNDGAYQGDVAPIFGDECDGDFEAAITLDGVNDLVEVAHQASLPIYNNPAYSVAMWVKGLPQPDHRVYAESSTTSRAPLFNIGTQNTGAAGTVDIFIRNGANQTIVNHINSTGIAFDDEWHHIAWTDENGQAALYIDGVRDATNFNYTKQDMVFDRTVIGGIIRDVPSHWFGGMIDDVRVYNHALTALEIEELAGECSVCPAAGDTHCGSISVVGPPGNLIGAYMVTATGAVDNSGDPIRYYFEAMSDAGLVVAAGPQPESSAALVLGPGTWTVSVTTDDDQLCADRADDATCTAPPIVVVCPTEGDTHCGTINVTPPAIAGTGTHAIEVAGAVDDSGDAITYAFRAVNERGLVIAVAAQANAIAQLNLGPGMWSITATVDDGADCPDAAVDATCETVVDVVCPGDADTHCDDLVVTGPPDGTPGLYTVSVLSALDDSGDPIEYNYTAVADDGRVVVLGASAVNTAMFLLPAGNWTIKVFVDDNPGCFDAAVDATCEASIEVVADPAGLISHWKFDGDTLDSGPSVNDGVFVGDVEPTFVDGFDGTPAGAIQLDGIDDHVDVLQNRNLPLYAHDAFTVAMWVMGPPAQVDRRVWSEGWSGGNPPLYNIGTDNAGVTGQVDLYVRTNANQVLLNHVHSGRNAFDNSWHHIAFTDDRGTATLYIDGVRDGTAFNYARTQIPFDKTSIGAVLRAAAGNFFAGAIDDVRVYNHALSAAEVLALVPPPAGCPGAGDSHCAGLTVVGPGGGGPGIYTATVSGAADDSGDTPIYTFTATDAAGTFLQVGPQAASTADFTLHPGSWTVTATVDDDLGCRDQAPDAACSQGVAVGGAAAPFLSHWKLDGDLLDAQPAANHGTFAGGPAPAFTADRDGNAASALQTDGADDYVVVTPQTGLPLYSHRDFTVAMWVNGLPQPDRRVWSESSTENNAPLFNIGTANTGLSGRADIFIRDQNNVTHVNHAQSGAEVFDGNWHHIAWVDRAGAGTLYVDGAPDLALSYPRAVVPFNRTTLGGILRATPAALFNGSIDDVRAYTRALTAAEVCELAGCGPAQVTFHRGDVDDNGRLELTDAVRILGYLFLGNAAPTCFEAADSDDNGSVQLTDAVRILGYLFLGNAPPAPPGPPEEPCGPDPQGSPSVGCESYTSC